MKKIFTLFLVMFALTAVGCGQFANMENPVVEYDSLDEINKKADTFLVDIKEYGTVSEERFSVIDNRISEYAFVIDGYDICFRSSKDLQEDISGIYVDGEPAFTDFSALLSFGGDSEHKAVRFVDGDRQYTVTSTYKDDPDDELFLEYLGLLENKVLVTLSSPEIVEMAGDYIDINSDGTEATIFLYGINEPWLEISWVSSDSEYDTWMFELKEAGNGKYNYDAFSHYHFVCDEEGEINDVVEMEDSAPGYVEYKDGKISMDGTDNERLMSFVFEKVQE